MKRLVFAPAVLVALGALLLGGAAVSRAALVPGCSAEPVSRPFLRWADPAAYTLVPDGGFEQQSSAWLLAGGAGVVAGNEPFRVRGPADSASLALPPGSAATSAPTCLGAGHPTLRLFAVNHGSLLSTLAVDVVYVDASGVLRTVAVASLTGTAAWQPTIPVALLANAAAAISPGGTLAVSVRFRPVGTAGSWRIDDVYVDPYKIT